MNKVSLTSIALDDVDAAHRILETCKGYKKNISERYIEYKARSDNMQLNIKYNSLSQKVLDSFIDVLKVL